MAHPGGRPTLYDSAMCVQVEKLCKLSATDKEIADFFEISEATLYNWKNEYPKFLEAIKRGKLLADSNVADSLYNRAMGYEHKEDDIKVCDKEIVITPTIKHYPPDPTALIFWLKNRQPEKWRDRRETELSGHLDIGDKLAEARARAASDD
jgi:hypothetical protein